MIRKFLNNESGATAIEYTLLAALIGVALIGTLTQLRGTVDDTLNEVDKALDKAQKTS